MEYKFTGTHQGWHIQKTNILCSMPAMKMIFKKSEELVDTTRQRNRTYAVQTPDHPFPRSHLHREQTQPIGIRGLFGECWHRISRFFVSWRLTKHSIYQWSSLRARDNPRYHTTFWCFFFFRASPQWLQLGIMETRKERALVAGHQTALRMSGFTNK